MRKDIANWGSSLSALIGVMCLLQLLLLSPTRVGAAERGASTFIPGTHGDFAAALTPAPGVYVRDTLFHYSAERHQTTGVNAKIDVDFWVNYSFLSVVTDWTIFGAKYNFALGIPLVDGDVNQFIAGAPQFDFRDNRTANGDLFVVPVSLFWNRGDLSINLYEYIVAPTGAFSRNKIAAHRR